MGSLSTLAVHLQRCAQTGAGVRVAASQAQRFSCIGVRKFAVDAKDAAKDEAAQAQEALKEEATKAKAQAKKQSGKVKKHAFFASWYLLIAAGVFRWYQKKLREKNEGTVERDAEVKFRRRITGANVSRSA